MDLKAHLKALLDANSIDAVWEVQLDAMAGFGFDRLLYGCTRFLTPNSIGDPQDTILLTNLGADYLSGFVDGGLYFDAPMTKWARLNDGPCSWALLTDMATTGALSEAERRVIAFNRARYVTAGYTLSFPAISQRSKGAIALIARRGLSQAEVDGVWADHGEELWLANSVAHLKIMTLPHTTARPLTARQREVLQWVGDGKTMQEIATLMGLTPATVEKHLRLARETLDVATTAQAVAKATTQNQMFVIEH